MAISGICLASSGTPPKTNATTAEKAEITIYGTNSGWWPLPGRDHTALSLQVGDRLYWFDAGGSVGSAACAAGVPILNTKAIFLTHPHFDHVGGLQQLLWMIYRVGVLRGYEPVEARYKHYVDEATVYGSNRSQSQPMPDVPIYTNTPELLPPILEYFKYTEPNFKLNYTVHTEPLKTGMFYDDGTIQVEARTTKHLPERNGIPQSWAFRIHTAGKTIVFSGDIRYVEDLGDWWRGADLYLIEHAHVPAEETYQEIKKRNPIFPKLVYLHHDFGSLYEDKTYASEMKAKMPEAIFAKDGEKIFLK